ncbi:MAG: alginate lyase family protein, partial [Planctomycetes bacterium]|nr:alginate lyase family protein [Planctomycetota bacterium]
MAATRDLLKTVEGKIAGRPWAKALAAELIAEADKWAARPINPPTTGGGWYHNYVCPKDAGFLEFREDSPRKHWCPRCKKFYEGDKLDASWVNRRHMDFAQAAQVCAVAFRVGGKPQHADWARRVLRWYADRYETFPVHGEWAGRGRVMGQSLDEAMWLIPMATAFDLVAKTVGDADQQAIIGKLILPAGKHIEGYSGGIHNIQCWHATARLMAGLVGSDVTMRDRAVADLRDNIDKGITQDGFWFEGSITYHSFTLMALTPALVVAKHNGIDLGRPDKLLAMYTVPAKLVLPSGVLPALNDGGGANLSSMAWLLETGCYLFDSEPLRRQLASIHAGRERTQASMSYKIA